MKTIGKRVCLLAAGGGIPRNGEGAFARLRDGRILYAFSEYYGTSGGDADPARIAAVCSHDEGETWGERRILLEPDPGDRNIGSVSFLRMENGDLGMFFLRKTGEDCRLNLVRSADEGETWSTALPCFGPGYYVTNNDRVVKLESGRILIPANRHPVPSCSRSVQGFFASDDDGHSWFKLNPELSHPFPESSTGLQEGGIYQFPDGRIWNYARTRSGSQFMSYSRDDGLSWTAPRGSEIFTGPDSPMLVKDAGPFTLAVFNPKPRYFGRKDLETAENDKDLWARTPLVCLVSLDRGATFPEGFLLEGDPENAYCYPALLPVSDGFLVSYYHSNGSGRCLTSTVIRKVLYSELTGGYTGNRAVY